ncbi:hypothetical protein K432DRAFT_287085 [Lepidopterella palustris CBS 459.81]|uniref:AttH domain-containing protein n=1 Tax=Lepidopterella palustris CBS 459.81 TaxID=1314670 RepID=A0A8E2EK19_9PEZI|nr:hypothetical protein K432DRAFT_287085 [Lepidopterella palustris CBS 459.81]
MDITAKHYWGSDFFIPGQLSVTTIDSQSPELLHIRATTEDQFSQFSAVSVYPKCSFNLTHAPKGPNSYQAAAGTYWWGTGRAWAYDAPEAWTEGTLTINGGEVKVIPEQSMTWLDFQWGPGYADAGWYSFVVLLDNGVKITTMTTYSTPEYPMVSVATILFLDGHHEVYVVDTDFHPSDPWVSSATNITYYKSYTINIPGKRTCLHARLAMEGGELYLPSQPTRAGAIADTFSYFEGVFDGKPVTGWGNSERKAVNT